MQNRVQLPTGDFLKEVLPGFIVNILYITGFLIFISLMVAGVILIFGWGNEESNTQAKRILIYGAYAIALLALGYALIFGISKINFSETENTNDDLYTTSVLHTDFAVIQLDPDLKPDSIPDYQSEDPLSSDHPETAATQTLLLKVGNLISKVLLFTAGLAIVFLIVAGANYIFAFGKDERIEKARRGIFWSITGLLIILLSYAIARGLVSILLQTDASVR